MKKPEFLKSIHIGEIIRTEMKKRRITENRLVNLTSFTKWIIRDTFKQKSIKINRLIVFSYALKVNLLDVYLKKMPSFGNTIHYDDEAIIENIDGQLSMILSKKNRTASFTENIHIGELLKAETRKQSMQDALPNIFNCSQSAVNRIFDNSDIDTERLIWMSYILDYDFLRNVYLPYMAVNKDETIANDSIFDLRAIRFKPEIISVVMEKQTDIYHKIKSQE